MAMTTVQVLDKLRRILAEVDTSTSVLTDPELLAAVSDERDDLELEKVVDFDQLTVGYDESDTATYGILPSNLVTLELGTILAYRAAGSILRQTYRDRVSRGEIGTSWTSGLEGESTLQAGRDYQAQIDDVEEQAETLILIKRSPTSATRPQ